MYTPFINLLNTSNNSNLRSDAGILGVNLFQCFSVLKQNATLERPALQIILSTFGLIFLYILLT